MRCTSVMRLVLCLAFAAQLVSLRPVTRTLSRSQEGDHVLQGIELLAQQLLDSPPHAEELDEELGEELPLQLPRLPPSNDLGDVVEMQRAMRLGATPAPAEVRSWSPTRTPAAERTAAPIVASTLHPATESPANRSSIFETPSEAPPRLTLPFGASIAIQCCLAVLGCMTQAAIGFGTGIVFLLCWRILGAIGVDLGPLEHGSVSVIFLDAAIAASILLVERHNCSRVMLVLMLPGAFAAPLGALVLKHLASAEDMRLWVRLLGAVFISIALAKTAELLVRHFTAPAPRGEESGRKGVAGGASPPPVAGGGASPPPYEEACGAEKLLGSAQAEPAATSPDESDQPFAEDAPEDVLAQREAYEAALARPPSSAALWPCAAPCRWPTARGLLLSAAALVAGLLQGTFGVGGPVYLVFFLFYTPPRVVIRATLGCLYVFTTAAWLITASVDGLLVPGNIPLYGAVLAAGLAASLLGIWMTEGLRMSRCGTTGLLIGLLALLLMEGISDCL